MTGSAERGLLRQGLRYALVMRLAVMAAASLVSLFVEPAPRPGVAVAVVLAINAWNAVYATAMARRAARVRRWLVPVDVLVVCGACLTQVWTAAPDVGADGMSWVLVMAEITIVSYPWQIGTAALAAVTAAVVPAYLVGAVIARPDEWLVSAPFQLWLVMEAALSWGLYKFVRRAARAADRQVERGELLRRDAAIAASRRVDEHEYLAALHDTASATLLMVGAGVVPGPRRWLADQAARDLDVISEPSVASHREVDLMGRLREVAGLTPLRVRLRGPDALSVPAVTAATLCHGTREALTNVVRHSGVAEADITASLDGDTVVVEVADAGRGFDAEHLPRHGYGVTRSLVERMRRVGGRAEVVSAPGQGCRVRMECPRTTRQFAADDTEVIGTAFQTGLGWAVVVMNLVILFLLDLPKLLTNLDTYRAVWPQVLAWGGFLAITAWAALVLRRGRQLGRWRWVLVAVVFALSALATESIPPEHRLGAVHWSEGDAGWTVALLLLDARAVVFVGVLLAQYAMTFGHAALAGDSAVSFAGLVNATVIVLGYQLAVGLIAAVLRGLAASSAKVARAEEELRTAEAVAEQLHRDRMERYAGLADTTVPLLRGLASGALDPGDEGVRQRCAVEAAKMRRLFAEDTTAPDQLLHELRACIELAERNGISVSFAECGVRPEIPRVARRTLTEPAVAALATARGRVRLTVSGSDGSVTVSVVADCPPHLVPEPNTDGVRTSTLVDGDRVWVQATWQGGR
ncbi:ATP-binding protein [Goodfellowiella coeruleoviolacea]|uniref:Histidine kinase-, DNA gyrase B-, and HSP90-like ATPase n=1 Tax=Goodfellowiella coeruleoviolacea TaxID=334858 RepID=A0AAE3GKW6_9PSEU|nr:ATP-binding protein [Goodfellowiella coeruleoviolacea]MCP2170147.1 Histidine kinase-, DNA gyrase B-, and HSP90-like ATPase [Goodfellowiella coeruleoviolacea]